MPWYSWNECGCTIRKLGKWWCSGPVRAARSGPSPRGSFGVRSTRGRMSVRTTGRNVVRRINFSLVVASRVCEAANNNVDAESAVVVGCERRFLVSARLIFRWVCGRSRRCWPAAIFAATHLSIISSNSGVVVGGGRGLTPLNAIPISTYSLHLVIFFT